MTKEFLNVEVVSIVQAINELLTNTDKVKELPIKMRWAIKKNILAFSPTVKTFEDLRRELVEELQKEFFNDEKSHPVETELENGEKEEARQVNDEYLVEYEEKVRELNGKLEELLNEKNEYEIYTIDMDEFVNGISTDTKLEFNDIDLLSFMGEE